MAEQNLRVAAEIAARHPGAARRARRRRRGDRGLARRGRRHARPVRRRLGVHPQDEGFTHHELMGLRAPTDQYPLLLHFPYFDLYRKQVVKQADLVLALLLRGDASPPRRRRATSPTTSR